MSTMQALADEQARSMGVASLPVQSQSDGNAATDGKAIFFNANFMQTVRSSAGDGGVRFVLAHEIGHARTGMGGGHKGELTADRWAARSVARLGFGWEAVSGVMRLLDPAASSTHPGRSTRACHAYAEWQGVSQSLEFKKRSSQENDEKFTKKSKHKNIQQREIREINQKTKTRRAKQRTRDDLTL